MRLCRVLGQGTLATFPSFPEPRPDGPKKKEQRLSATGSMTPEQAERLAKIHERLIEARRELDALIGDAYLRPRASIVPVHFLDLASAVEKLRWAEKEWRELDREMEEAPSPTSPELVGAESNSR